MTPEEHFKSALEAANRGDWDMAISHGTHAPINWDVWSKMPHLRSPLLGGSGMSDEGINKILDIMTHPNSSHKKNLGSFLFELSEALPQDLSADTLNRIGDLGKGDRFVTQHITGHPNYKPNDRVKSLMEASRFWNDYEKKVDPSHFAAIKSLFTGKQENIRDHRGSIGDSSKWTSALPHLRDYAKEVQDAVLADQFIHKKDFFGEPHIKVFRGVGGHYGKKIRDAAHFNPITGEVDKKKFIIPTAHLTSWSLNPDQAAIFAHSRGDIPGHPANEGIVIGKWVPVKSILHSGFHSIHIGHDLAHPSEEEIVVGHPEGKTTVSTPHMKFQKPKHNFGDVEHGVLRKIEELFELDLEPDYDTLEKNMKGLAARSAMALSLLGVPQHIAQEAPKTTTEAQRNIAPHPGLAPIKMIESSGGKNLKHKMVMHGLNMGTRALGSYGLMPVQIHEIFKHDPHLTSKYPQVAALDPKSNEKEMDEAMRKNKQLEVELANSHWRHLQNIFDNDEDKMAYAWLHGITGTLNTNDEDVKRHPYVQDYHKYKGLLNLDEESKEDVKKAEPSEKLDPVSDPEKVDKFMPMFATDYNKITAHEINEAIDHGQIHDLSNMGHFTHESFLAGADRDDSWLIKIDPPNRPGIKSAKYGSQAFKEAAFAAAAKDVFGMGKYVPRTILGEVEKGGRIKPAAAIRLLPPNYKIAVQYEKDKKSSMVGILEKYRRSGVMHQMALMLYVLGDGDSHGQNVMTDGNEIVLIDHGSSFGNELFNPAHDSKIFVPYILRIGRIRTSWTPEKKLKQMPHIDEDKALVDLKHWIFHLDPELLKKTLILYGINPIPAVDRLKAIQKLAAGSVRPDDLINSLWIKGLDLESRSDTNETNSAGYQAHN